jgi:hypothetical protein
MNSMHPDEELGKKLRLIANALGFSPEAFLEYAKKEAESQHYSVPQNFVPSPTCTSEFTIAREHLAEWPEWTSKLIPPGSKMEELCWPDGSIVQRLLSPRALVLASCVEHPKEYNT